MRPGIILYLLMAVWLIGASGARIALQLENGLDLDVLPVIGFFLGCTALTYAGILHDQWLHRKDDKHRHD